MFESLRKLIEPHFLRRTKEMVLGNNRTETDGDDSSKYDISCHTRLRTNYYLELIHSTQTWVVLSLLSNNAADSVDSFVNTYPVLVDSIIQSLKNWGLICYITIKTPNPSSDKLQPVPRKTMFLN